MGDAPAYIEEAKTALRQYINMSFTLTDAWLTNNNLDVNWYADTEYGDWRVSLRTVDHHDHLVPENMRYLVSHDIDTNKIIIDELEVVNGIERYHYEEETA